MISNPVQLPCTFDVRTGTDKNGRACVVVTFNNQMFDKYVAEVTNCYVQVSFIPELAIYGAEKAWHYNIVCSTDGSLSKHDIHIEQLQEELIGVIASLSLVSAKKRTAKRSSSTSRSTTRRPVKRNIRVM